MALNVDKVSVKIEKTNLYKHDKKNISNISAQIYQPYEEVDYNKKEDNDKNSMKFGNAFSILQQRIFRIVKIEGEYLRKIKGLDKDSIEYRNATLDYKIELAGVGTRDAVVAAATYLSEEEDIPYYWGGKRLEHGIDESWGEDRVMNWEGTDVQFQGSSYPYGLDCSGFVSWAIYNGGYDIQTYWTGGYSSYAKEYDFNLSNLKSEKIKAGDLLYREGHIAIITELNLEKGTIKVAEEKGYLEGMVVTEKAIDEYVNIENFTKILSLEEYYNNKDNLIK